MWVGIFETLREILLGFFDSSLELIRGLLVANGYPFGVPGGPDGYMINFNLFSDNIIFSIEAFDLFKYVYIVVICLVIYKLIYKLVKRLFRWIFSLGGLL